MPACQRSRYAVVDVALSPDFRLGVDLETFIRRKGRRAIRRGGAEHEPEVAQKLRMEERESELVNV